MSDLTLVQHYTLLLLIGVVTVGKWLQKDFFKWSSPSLVELVLVSTTKHSVIAHWKNWMQWMHQQLKNQHQHKQQFAVTVQLKKNCQYNINCIHMHVKQNDEPSIKQQHNNQYQRDIDVKAVWFVQVVTFTGIDNYWNERESTVWKNFAHWILSWFWQHWFNRRIFQKKFFAELLSQLSKFGMENAAFS